MELDDFTLVGAGSLGTVLCRSLNRIGMRLDQVVIRGAGSRGQVLQETGASSVVLIDEWSGPVSSLVLLAVPDDALSGVAERLSGQGEWAGKTVLHTSGVHNRSVLDAFARRGAFTGSFHPLQTFLGSEDVDAFRGITVGIEGDQEAVAVAKHLADDLLAEAIELSSERKSLYHAAAVLASNAATTLLSVSEEMWEHAAGTRDGFAGAMGPLIRQSMENALTIGPESALTGPIARGDRATLEAHFMAISAYMPHLLAMYGSVATETVHLAMRAGRLSAEQAVALLDVINDHITGEPSQGGHQ
jgi:predicted short-subunit dehydrogenase-like oxidoreductase (DUF2520 family)